MTDWQTREEKAFAEALEKDAASTGFAPLDRRYKVWKDFVGQYGLKEKAVWGVVNDTVPASVADQTKAVLRANPDITVIFTPWVLRIAAARSLICMPCPCWLFLAIIARI